MGSNVALKQALLQISLKSIDLIEFLLGASV